MVDGLKEKISFLIVKNNDYERLMEYVFDLNKINMQYHPVASDSIDCQLASIINNTNKYNFERGIDTLSKAKMLFIRESEGVYSYCKRRVIIMKDGDRLRFRVGGGFMSLEEFIENYTILKDMRGIKMIKESIQMSNQKTLRGSPKGTKSNSMGFAQHKKSSHSVSVQNIMRGTKPNQKNIHDLNSRVPTDYNQDNEHDEFSDLNQFQSEKQYTLDAEESGLRI